MLLFFSKHWINWITPVGAMRIKLDKCCWLSAGQNNYRCCHTKAKMSFLWYLLQDDNWSMWLRSLRLTILFVKSMILTCWKMWKLSKKMEFWTEQTGSQVLHDVEDLDSSHEFVCGTCRISLESCLHVSHLVSFFLPFCSILDCWLDKTVLVVPR